MKQKHKGYFKRSNRTILTKSKMRSELPEKFRHRRVSKIKYRKNYYHRGATTICMMNSLKKVSEQIKLLGETTADFVKHVNLCSINSKEENKGGNINE